MNTTESLRLQISPHELAFLFSLANAEQTPLDYLTDFGWFFSDENVIRAGGEAFRDRIELNSSDHAGPELAVVYTTVAHRFTESAELTMLTFTGDASMTLVHAHVDGLIVELVMALDSFWIQAIDPGDAAARLLAELLSLEGVTQIQSSTYVDGDEVRALAWSRGQLASVMGPEAAWTLLGEVGLSEGVNNMLARVAS